MTAAGSAGEAVTPGQAASRVSVEATELNEDETGWTEAGIFIDRGDGTELAEQMLLATPAELDAIYAGLKLHFEQGIWSFRTVAQAAIAAQQPQADFGDPEVAYEQWLEPRNPEEDISSMGLFTAGWQAAVTAASGWPLCPNGCGCRLGSEDAEVRDCACDGLCCYDEIEVSEVFAERDKLRRQLAEQPAPELAAAKLSDVRVIALADVTAVRAWHPDDEPAELAALRDAIAAIVSDLEASAKATAPSKESVTVWAVAERLQALLDKP